MQCKQRNYIFLLGKSLRLFRLYWYCLHSVFHSRNRMSYKSELLLSVSLTNDLLHMFWSGWRSIPVRWAAVSLDILQVQTCHSSMPCRSIPHLLHFNYLIGISFFFVLPWLIKTLFVEIIGTVMTRTSDMIKSCPRRFHFCFDYFPYGYICEKVPTVFAFLFLLFLSHRRNRMPTSYRFWYLNHKSHWPMFCCGCSDQGRGAFYRGEKHWA